MPPTITSTSNLLTIGTKWKLIEDEDDNDNKHEEQTKTKDQSDVSMSSTIDVHPITTEVTYPIGMQTPFFCHICHSLLNCTVAIESNIYIGAYYNPQLLPD